MYRSILPLVAHSAQVFCLAIMPISSTDGVAQAEVRQASPALATWLWDTTMITKPAQVTRLLTFSSTNAVSKIYAQIDADIPNSAWQNFISQCSAHGIVVEALMGNPEWVLGTGTPSLQAGLDWIQQFQGSAPSTSKFAGIHMDIEPWTLDGWSDNQAAYIQAWEDIVQQVVSFGRSLGMAVAADLPFWAYTLSSTTPGQTLDIWLLNMLTSATFMTYRNTAADVESLASMVLAAGVKTGKPVWLAVETNQDGESPKLSYYGKGKSTLQSDLKAIATSVGKYTSFAGIAVHDYIGWKAMR